MSWIINKAVTQIELAEKLRSLLIADDIIKIPGVHDAMAAIIAKNTGFQALYLSGAAYTASRGLPDLGIINSRELADHARDIIRATNLPLIVDVDTGFGGILNVARTAKEMVEVGVAAVQIEDQDLPKKCGHLNGKKLISPEEMVEKIKIIKEIAPSLIVVARTDAASIEGVHKAIERANLYIEAGADIVFPEAFTNKDDFILASQSIHTYLLANMTEFGITPYYTAEEFKSFGYKMVIYPVTSLRVAAKAYEKVFAEIFDKGTQRDVLDNMQSRAELYETIEYFEYEKLDKKIARTKLNHNQ